MKVREIVSSVLFMLLPLVRTCAPHENLAEDFLGSRGFSNDASVARQEKHVGNSRKMKKSAIDSCLRKNRDHEAKSISITQGSKSSEFIRKHSPLPFNWSGTLLNYFIRSLVQKCGIKIVTRPRSSLQCQT